MAAVPPGSTGALGKLTLAFALLLAVAGLTVRSTFAFRDSFRWESRTHEVIEDLLRAQDALRDDDLATRDLRALAALRSARALMTDAALTPKVDALLATSSPAAGRLAAVQSLIDAEREVLRRRVDQTERDLSAIVDAQLVAASVSLMLIGLTFFRLHDEVALRRRSEADARSGQLELATTLDSLREGVFATDAHGLVTRMNRAAQTLSGLTGEAAIGKPIVEVCPLAQGDARPFDPVGAVLAGGTDAAPPPAVTLARPGRPALTVEVSCVALPQAGAVLVVRDVSDAHEARLAQEAAHRQLVLADRLAAVGLLAAGVAREINNPLSYVTSNLEALALAPGGQPPDDWRQLVRDALVGAGRMRKIVRSLKTFSRADDERPRLIDIAPVIELAVELTNGEIRQRARLEKRYGPTPRVLGDEVRLGQVIINLIVNAVQALEPGSSREQRITITTATDAHGAAVIELEDTGQGIAPELLGRIFDPFFTTKPVGVGTGLGLSICHHIVRSMGGQLEVESQLGVGSTFRVRLPPAPAAAAAAPTPPPPLPASGPRARVMIIDDDPMVAHSLARILSGYEVIVVTGAARALALLDDELVLILCDLMMPSMSGMGFYEELLRTRPALTSRVVFMTGGVFTDEAQAFVARLPPGHLVEKPVRAAEVLALAARFREASLPRAH